MNNRSKDEKVSNPLTLAANILHLAKSLLGLADTLRKFDREQREGIAQLFENTRESLSAFAEEITNDRLSHGVCEQLLGSAKSLVEFIRTELEYEHADELERFVQYTCNGNALQLVLSSEQNKISSLTMIDEATGKFRALVNILLAS